jgi:hypothetical protein
VPALSGATRTGLTAALLAASLAHVASTAWSNPDLARAADLLLLAIATCAAVSRRDRVGIVFAAGFAALGVASLAGVRPVAAAGLALAPALWALGVHLIPGRGFVRAYPLTAVPFGFMATVFAAVVCIWGTPGGWAVPVLVIAAISAGACIAMVDATLRVDVTAGQLLVLGATAHLVAIALYAGTVWGPVPTGVAAATAIAVFHTCAITMLALGVVRLSAAETSTPVLRGLGG